MKEKLHNLAAQQLGVDPDAVPPLPPVVAVATPEPKVVEAEVVAAEPARVEPSDPAPPPAVVPPRRVMPHADALGESEIVVIAAPPLRATPPAPLTYGSDEPSPPITDFRAVMVLVVLLLLAGLMMYAINRSRF